MGSFPHGGCGPDSRSTPMMGAVCSAGRVGWKRCPSWAGQTTAKSERSAEKISASWNRKWQFLVGMITVGFGIQCSSFLTDIGQVSGHGVHRMMSNAPTSCEPKSMRHAVDGHDCMDDYALRACARLILAMPSPAKPGPRSSNVLGSGTELPPPPPPVLVLPLKPLPPKPVVPSQPMET
jgi:hypothetical protein